MATTSMSVAIHGSFAGHPAALCPYEVSGKAETGGGDARKIIFGIAVGNLEICFMRQFPKKEEMTALCFIQ